jgi:hypothetical protein
LTLLPLLSQKLRVRHVVITDIRKIEVYGDGVSYSNMTFILIFEKIVQLVQEFKWDTHQHTHTHGGIVVGIQIIQVAGRSALRIPGAYPTSYSVDTKVSFSGSSGRCVMSNTILHLVPMLRITGVIPLHLLHVFIARTGKILPLRLHLHARARARAHAHTHTQ